MVEKALTTVFPFLDSIFPVLLNTEAGAAPLRFSSVQTVTEFLPGIYDYSFFRLFLEGKYYILWNIYDHTDLYTELRKHQQQKNELDMYCEYLEQRFVEIKRPEDILK